MVEVVAAVALAVSVVEEVVAVASAVDVVEVVVMVVCIGRGATLLIFALSLRYGLVLLEASDAHHNTRLIPDLLRGGE